jgi:hypothetical protein
MSLANFIENGQLTEDVLLSFKEKIAQSGMTKCAIARRFGVSPITLHKWLSGGTHRCSLSARQKISSFIGEENPGEGVAFQYNGSSHIFPDNILLCMERISKAYDLCNTSKDKARDFIGIMDKAALDALQRLAYSNVNKAEGAPAN